MQDFRQMAVWQKAHELTLAVYRVTAGFPREERYGIISQTRRCAASVPANLAEGRCRRTDKDFARFVEIALGSASETDYHLLLARDLGYLPSDEYANLARLTDEVRRMLIGLQSRLSSSQD
jgi:four helix bundle protein